MTEISYELLSAIAPILIGALGIAYGLATNTTLKKVIKILQAEAREGACYMRIKADGIVTVEESDEMAKLSITKWEAIEDVTGAKIFNNSEVPWIKPEEPKLISSLTEVKA